MRSVSLLWIEFRRSLGLLLFPLLVAVGWLVSRDVMYGDAYVWLDTSAGVRSTAILLGPIIGGVTAWMAGRSGRRGMIDMLSATPYSTISRDLGVWVGTALWGVGAYALLAVVLGALTWWNATWGTPIPGYFLVGLAAMVCHSAIGYAAGRWFPSRFTAPLVAVVLYGLQGMFMFNLESSARYLVPYGPDPGASSVFYETSLNVYAPQSVWFVGFAALTLSTLALKRRRNPSSWIVLVLAASVVVFGAVLLLRMPPPAVVYERETLVPYEPVCEEGRIPVCVHPAYEKALPETVALVDDLVGPLVGLPGAPERAEQRGRDAAPARLLSDGTLVFDLRGGFSRWNANMGVSFRDYKESDIAPGLVSRETGNFFEEEEFYSDNPCAKLGGSAYQARLVVLGWLLWQTDRYDSMESEPFADAMNDVLCPRTKAAIKRFDALDPVERREWLEKNYADLRAGEVVFRDLP